MQRLIKLLVCCAGTICLAASEPAWAQPRVQFPTPGSTGATTVPGGTYPAAPPLTTTPINPGGTVNVQPPPGATLQPPPGATLQPPTFDPFSTQPGGAAASPPALFNTPPPSPLTTQPAPGVVSPAPPQPLFGQPYPGYPAQPPAQFPEGLFVQGAGAPVPLPGPYLKAAEHPRARYTWLEGKSGNELDINDVDVAVTFNWPSFLHSGQPLRISPGFSFHFWDGPSPPFDFIPFLLGGSPFAAAELPSKAYSAYIQTDWTTSTQLRFGGEVAFNVGVYSDFQHVISDSVRFQGTGLGWFRITEHLTLKGGVTYLDRVDIKLLPAAGLFWYPNEDVRFEIYFPRPKLAQRLTTLGNTDIWWYVGGEYGGGSWTIEATNRPVPGGILTANSRTDINDIRVFGGLEWLSGLPGITGFVEGGYVFNREIVSHNTLFLFNGVPFLNTPTGLKLEDTFMLRAGFAF